MSNSIAQVSESQNLRTYENPDIQLRFSYPTDWGNIILNGSEVCQQSSCVFGLDGSNTTYRFSFSILTLSKDVCNCTSLLDLVIHGYNYDSSSIDELSFVNGNQTTIGKNYSGWQYEYSHSYQGENATGLSVFATNNATYYVIGVSYPEESRAKLIPDFKRLIESIEFLPVQNEGTKTPSFVNAVNSNRFQ